MHIHFSKQHHRRGFSLVELMIVVSILALLVSISVPNFLRARQRSQATRILEDARVLAAAKDQWALDTNQRGDTPASVEALHLYLRTPTHTGLDLLGHPYILGTVDEPLLVDTQTIVALRAGVGVEDEPTFWGPHYPAELLAENNQGNP